MLDNYLFCYGNVVWLDCNNVGCFLIIFVVNVIVDCRFDVLLIYLLFFGR